METKAVVIRDWEDLVFDHRNKDYGAYALRRAYSRRLILGWGLSTALMAIMLMLPGVLPESVKVPILPVIIDNGQVKLSPPPALKPLDPPKKPSSPVKSQSRDLPPLVTQEVVEQVNEPVTETPTVIGEGQALGTGADFSEGLTGVVEAPAVPTPPKIFDGAEIMPSYEGGLQEMMRFLKRKIRYPNEPLRQGIDGTVYVGFVVMADGSLADIKIIRGVHPDYDKEALRVVGLLKSWLPGKQNGNPVSVRMVLPIKFTLPKN